MNSKKLSHLKQNFLCLGFIAISALITPAFADAHDESQKKSNAKPNSDSRLSIEMVQGREIRVCGSITENSIGFSTGSLPSQSKSYLALPGGRNQTVIDLRTFNLTLLDRSKKYCVEGYLLESNPKRLFFNRISLAQEGEKDGEIISEVKEIAKDKIHGKIETNVERTTFCGYYQDFSADKDYAEYIKTTVPNRIPIGSKGQKQNNENHTFYVKKKENGKVTFKGYPLDVSSKSILELNLRSSALELMKQGGIYCLTGVVVNQSGQEAFKILGEIENYAEVK